MKIMQLTLTIILLLNVACSDDEQVEQDPSIYGTWKLVEIFDGGSPQPHQEIENGYVLDFALGGQVMTTNRTIGCPEGFDELFGSFSIMTDQKAETISLSFECSAQTSISISYYFGFDNGFLLLTEKENSCDEGCYFRFRKVVDVPLTE